MSKAYLTAIKRNKLSAPMRWLHENEHLSLHMLDYGCGKGDDARILSDDLGYYCVGYDPHHSPDEDVFHQVYDVVTCNYVLNVIPQCEREKVLAHLKTLADHVYVTVRRDLKQNYIKTSKGTEQWQVYLDAEIVKETSGFCIYKVK